MLTLRTFSDSNRKKRTFSLLINPLTPVPAVTGCDEPSPLSAGGGGGVLPYMGYIGMCGPKGYGFSAVLVINRVSNLADSGHK